MIRPAALSALALAAVILSSSGARAQIGLEQPDRGRPKPGPAPAPVQEPDSVKGAAPAHIRAFLLPSDGSFGEVLLRAQITGMEAPVVLASIAPGVPAASSGYQQIDGGTGAYEMRAGEQLLGSGTLRLIPGRAYTIVGWQSGQAWQTKVFPDDGTPGATTRPLRVLNFPAGRETLLSFKEGEETKIPPNSVQEFSLTPQLTAISAKVLSRQGGPPTQSSIELNLRELPSAYVVIMPDNVGRMLASFIEGGAPAAEEAAPIAQTVPQVDEERHRRGLMRMDLEQQLVGVIMQLSQSPAGPARSELEAKKREIEQQLQKAS
jgi:hypothetical protein